METIGSGSWIGGWWRRNTQAGRSSLPFFEIWDDDDDEVVDFFFWLIDSAGVKDSLCWKWRRCWLDDRGRPLGFEENERSDVARIYAHLTKLELVIVWIYLVRTFLVCILVSSIWCGLVWIPIFKLKLLSSKFSKDQLFYFIFFRCLEFNFEFLDMNFFNPIKLSLRMVVNSSV